MPKSNHEKQDQRNGSSMEDSSMTIEFLRARLLAERSVSKSARQRAEELAKRVEELEEQLRIVSLQRRMAEKATVDVLTILENQGISDTSEAFDSSSDQEAQQQPHEGNHYPNQQGHFASRRRSELEEFSGSDRDASPVSGRSLSWKGRSKSPRSRENYKNPSMRRRNAYSSLGSSSSSSRHHLGKSCRQIRRRETRTVVEEHKTEPIKFDSLENEFASTTPPEDVLDCSDSRSGTVRKGSESKKVLSEGPLSGGVGSQRSTNHLCVNGHGKDRDMEKALEDQAQLIDQNEDLEKAQNEWEEKFRENNISTPDLYDPGNHSDITEERDEVKPQTLHNNGTDISDITEERDEVKPQTLHNNGTDISDITEERDEVKPQTLHNNGMDISDITEERDEVKPQALHNNISEVEEAKPKKIDLSKLQPNGISAPSHVEMVEDQTSSRTNSVGSRSQAQEFAFPTARERENQKSENNHDCQPSEILCPDPPLHGPLSTRSLISTSSEVGRSSHKRDVSEGQNDLYALVLHNPPNALDGVLNALKQAKLSLHQKINKLSPEGRITVNKSIEPSPFDTRIGDRTEIPVGCSGLFRLPTDFSAEEANIRANFLSSGSHLAPHYPDNRIALTAPDQFVSTSYFENQPGFRTDDRFFTSSSVPSGARASTLNSRYDTYSDNGLNRYNYTSHPSYPPFPDLMRQIPSDEGLLRPFPSSRSYGSSAERSPFYGDQVRPNMYR
ncbi:uncharacterized protein LOC133797809 [Humulus lupulus]|uniref:uncharacterized protein LOC133797809 n=1 Tax=Humulus lupulus TaxID=3486 RepID=UPI002B40D63A|nr:uncharacterized protein LOC133797809 [Humulus lupulus]